MVSSVGGHKIAGLREKKSRRFRRLLKLITGRRQTEWTGATRCPNQDGPSHKRESLISGKRAISFRIRLSSWPVADIRRGRQPGPPDGRPEPDPAILGPPQAAFRATISTADAETELGRCPVRPARSCCQDLKNWSAASRLARFLATAACSLAI